MKKLEQVAGFEVVSFPEPARGLTGPEPAIVPAGRIDPIAGEAPTGVLRKAADRY